MQGRARARAPLGTFKAPKGRTISAEAARPGLGIARARAKSPEGARQVAAHSLFGCQSRGCWPRLQDDGGSPFQGFHRDNVICLKPRPAGLGSYRAPLWGSKRYGRLLKAGFDCGTLAVALLILLGAPRLAWPQCPNPPCASGTPLEGWTFVDWQIYGIVTTLNGDPVAGVRVRVDPNAGMQKVTTVLTDLRGEYHTHVELDGALYPTLTVNVSASKPGYDDARESAEFKKTGEVREIDLILATKKKNPDKSRRPTWFHA